MSIQKNTTLPVWGGMECTINRVGNTYLDQLSVAGHYSRETDLDMIASLGIKTLRFPVLWEFHQPSKDNEIDWTWTESQLNRLQSHGVTPIAGLVHHGSGPLYTSMNSGSFPAGMKKYASQVARKFPWIEYYTPVNEPLTTARFSGLYGHWYPHHANDTSFCMMLLNELKAVVLSMKEVRKINPAAKLVQTEDLAKTYSTPLLASQAQFENERRWLTYDFLCGKVDADHPMWEYFIRWGITEKTLGFFLDNPCPPDILGLNYYVTSERFLDDDIEKYPEHMHGGNDFQRYVDTEAVRVDHNQPSGLKCLLKEVHERYGLPMAVTEVHLNCTREEQLRWFKEAWDSCSSLKEEGMDIKAITAWSLFGAYGWNKLLATRHGAEYEPGVFDLRSPYPRPTALATLVQSLNKQGHYQHPVLSEKGWWRRDERLIFDRPKNLQLRHRQKKAFAPPVLVCGSTGTLGRAFARACDSRAIPYKLLSRQDLDLCSARSVGQAIDRFQPWAIINAAGYVNIDEAENHPEQCFNVNTTGPAVLAKKCSEKGIRLLNFSSDQVFDGKKTSPYLETDHTAPLNVYGRSKAEMEQLVSAADPSSLIIRTSAFFSPSDNYNFIAVLINALREGRPFHAMSDIQVSPTYVPDLVNISLDLMIDGAKGIWHLANRGGMTWSDLALEAAQRSGLDKDLVICCKRDSLNLRAVRPMYGVMDSSNASLMPTLEHALDRYFFEISKSSGHPAVKVPATY